MGVVACASTPQPTQQLASASAAVRAAHEVGADTVPQAELHLRLAQEEIGRAQRLIRDDEMEDATRALRRAQADAELSLAITRAHASREAAVEAERRADTESSQVTMPSSQAQAVR
jgi:hypothetical protein